MLITSAASILNTWLQKKCTHCSRVPSPRFSPTHPTYTPPCNAQVLLFANAICTTAPFPFLPFMTRDFGYAPAEIGAQVGYWFKQRYSTKELATSERKEGLVECAGGVQGCLPAYPCTDYTSRLHTHIAGWVNCKCKVYRKPLNSMAMGESGCKSNANSLFCPPSVLLV